MVSEEDNGVIHHLCSSTEYIESAHCYVCGIAKPHLRKPFAASKAVSALRINTGHRRPVQRRLSITNLRFARGNESHSERTSQDMNMSVGSRWLWNTREARLERTKRLKEMSVACACPRMMQSRRRSMERKEKKTRWNKGGKE